MKGKRELILQTIIKEYIKNPVPVSSKYLQSRLDISISSATIRNYFKKMVEEGELEQEHISSGRIPAVATLKKYWRGRLSPQKPISIGKREKIKELSGEYHIFCEYKFFESSRLKEVINYNDRFLVLVFERGEFILEYSEPLYRFFNEFSGSDLSDLVNVCRQIGLTTLAKKLNAVSNEDINVTGTHELLEMVSENRDWGNRHIKEILDGTILDGLEPGLYFEEFLPKGYLAYNSKARIEEREAKLLCIGALYRDYETFFEKLTKE